MNASRAAARMVRRAYGREALELAQAQGWTVAFAGSGHLQFRAKGRATVVAPCTPGGPKAMRALVGKLRKEAPGDQSGRPSRDLSADGKPEPQTGKG